MTTHPSMTAATGTVLCPALTGQPPSRSLYGHPLTCARPQRGTPTLLPQGLGRSAHISALARGHQLVGSAGGPGPSPGDVGAVRGAGCQPALQQEWARECLPDADVSTLITEGFPASAWTPVVAGNSLPQMNDKQT